MEAAVCSEAYRTISLCSASHLDPLLLARIHTQHRFTNLTRILIDSRDSLSFVAACQICGCCLHVSQC